MVLRPFPSSLICKAQNLKQYLSSLLKLSGNLIYKDNCNNMFFVCFNYAIRMQKFYEVWKFYHKV